MCLKNDSQNEYFFFVNCDATLSADAARCVSNKPVGSEKSIFRST
jgi:hypothetical protein